MKRQTRTMLLNAATGIAIAATAALVLLPASVSAAPAEATTAVNVRAAPSTDARVVNRLRAGEVVDVQECNRGWCYVDTRGNDGWVNAQYLRNPGQPGQPGVNLGFTIQWPQGNTFQFGINTPGSNPPPANPPRPPRPPAPPPPPSISEACFYERSSFRGESLCVEAGDQIADLRRWGGEISSIENQDGLEVTVCTRTRLRGDCRTYTTSARQLGRFDDAIMSLRVD